MKYGLFKYQQKIYDEIKDKNSHALFMEAGTGKTIISLTCHENSSASKCLIICLASKVKEFEDDVYKFVGDNCKVCTLDKGFKKNSECLMENYDYYVVSFQSALNISDDLIKTINNDWSIIIDESQFIKNNSAKISKLCHKLGAKTTHKLILTGTPQNKGIIDYYSQLKFLGVFGTLKDFQSRFCEMGLKRFGNGVSFMDIIGYRNEEVFNKILYENSVFYKRDLTEDELPTEKTIYFNKPMLYNKFMKSRVYEDVGCTTSAVLRLRARQLCSGWIGKYNIKYDDKLKWVEDYITNVDTENRLVIFYNFQCECDDLEKMIRKTKRPLSIYNGKIKDVDNFEKHDNCVILVNYGSGGTGINWLVKSNMCVFYGLPEGYMSFEQARRRLDRIGQTKKPMFYLLVVRGSVEEDILQTIQTKGEYDDGMFQRYLERNGW